MPVLGRDGREPELRLLRAQPAIRFVDGGSGSWCLPSTRMRENEEQPACRGSAAAIQARGSPLEMVSIGFVLACRMSAIVHSDVG